MSGGNNRVRSAIKEGLATCHDCGKLLRLGGDETAHLEHLCPRCGAHVHFRKTDSISRTWALLVAAIILFVPANTLPIMKVIFLGSSESSTIMDGIIYFFQHGSFGIGLIIFTASVLVPLFKIIGLVLILLSLHFRWRSWLKHKTVMFRAISFIGRWSMLDIFVIALLVILVDFSSISSIAAAPAVTYFAGVVMMTMLAAHTLDPRLLWDAEEQSKNSTGVEHDD